MSHAGRHRFGLWMADHALALGGLALVALGVTESRFALTLGWAALGIAFFAWVAEADGLALPRPGRAAIRCSGGESPFAFTVRHRGRVLLFTRDEDVDHGWSDTYTVRQREGGPVVAPCWELPVGPRSEWSVQGRAAVGALRFEHHERVSYVDRGSLERALAGSTT